MLDGLVTVIINVYNCKDYLPTSLESVRRQTYKKLEIILVDDASTDGSGEFCDEFCRQDERFRVIHHKNNTGVSGPRNTGLKVAQGECIYFMDGDDYIHTELIERLYDAIQKSGIGLAVCDFSRTASLTNDIHRPVPDYQCELVSVEKVICEMLTQMDLKWCVVWNKLFKFDLLEGLFFNDYYSIQDQDFNIRIYQRLEYLVYVPAPLYWYYQNPRSLQRDTSLTAKRFYFNTMYRFRMLEHIEPGKYEKQYRAWILDYGYRQMVDRRKVIKGTEYETPFARMVHDILKETGKEYRHISGLSIRKKAKFYFSWYFPSFANVYERMVIWKRYGSKGQ